MIKQRTLNVCVVTTIFPSNLNFFQDFLDGLSCQSYEDFDLIIYNDGCNHDELVKKLYGFNFYIISDPSLDSITQIRNYIFEYLTQKSFDIIFFGDSDDFFNCDRISNSLEKHLTGSDIVFNDINIVDQGGKLIIENYWADRFNSSQINPKEILKYNFLGLGNTSIKSEILKTEIKFRRDLLIIDWAFYLQLIFKHNNLKISFSETPINYRQHSNNAIGLKKSWNSEFIRKRVELKINLLESYRYLDAEFGDEIESLRRTLKLLSNPSYMKKHLKKIKSKNLFWFEETIIE